MIRTMNRSSGYFEIMATFAILALVLLISMIII